MRNKPLKDIYKEVREAIKTKLENDDSLEEIKRVVYGEMQRIGRIVSPSIWIVPESYQPELRGGHSAVHDITFDFVVLVKDYNAEKGLQQAEDLAMNVYDVISADRTLGGVVSDVRPMRVDPAFEAGNSTQVYWSAVQFAFRLQRRE